MGSEEDRFLRPVAFLRALSPIESVPEFSWVSQFQKRAIWLIREES
jgi:hypothetical protein